MVGIEVGAYLRVYARWTFAFLASLFIASAHAIHVCRRATKVGEIALEVVHPNYLSDLTQDALLRAACDELSLMGGDCAECASSETSAVDIHRVLDHVVSRNALPLVFGVGESGVWQVKGGVQLLGSHRRIGWIYHGVLAVDSLQQPLCVHLVRLLLYMPDVLGLCPAVV